jgi:hypothetical protein
MNPARSNPDRTDERDVLPLESTIPADMTISEWRKMLAARSRRAPKRPRVAAAARRVVPLRPPSCDHLHATTTRYDHAEKRLTFLLVCPVCGTEKVLETMAYEPRFEPAQVQRAA